MPRSSASPEDHAAPGPAYTYRCRGEEPTQARDPAPDLDQVVEHPSLPPRSRSDRSSSRSMSSSIRSTARVVAGHGDVEQRREERLRVEQAVRGVGLDLVVQVVEERDRPLVRGDHRVRRRDDGRATATRAGAPGPAPRRRARGGRSRARRRTGSVTGGVERLGGAVVEAEGLGQPRDEALGHRAGDVDPQQLPLGRRRRQRVVELEDLVAPVGIEPSRADARAVRDARRGSSGAASRAAKPSASPSWACAGADELVSARVASDGLPWRDGHAER